jgi:hypothetical protein
VLGIKDDREKTLREATYWVSSSQALYGWGVWVETVASYKDSLLGTTTPLVLT